jgi:hypothetical protein
MGVHFEWDENKQVVVVQVEAPWTWEEFKVEVDKVYEQIAALDYPVAIIADIARMGPIPQGNLLRQLQYSQAHTPKNVKTTVLVGAPYIVTTFLNVVMKVRPNSTAEVLFALSAAEAKTLLQQRQQQLHQNKTG